MFLWPAHSFVAPPASHPSGHHHTCHAACCCFLMSTAVNVHAHAAKHLWWMQQPSAQGVPACACTHTKDTIAQFLRTFPMWQLGRKPTDGTLWRIVHKKRGILITQASLHAQHVHGLQRKMHCDTLHMYASRTCTGTVYTCAMSATSQNQAMQNMHQ